MVSVFKVDDTRFRVHGHFLSTHSPVFRHILRRHQNSSSTSDIKSSDSTCPARRVIRLKSVSALEFEALLTFFYERYVGRSFAGSYSGSDVF
jgi:hypothetical protein